MRIFVCVVFMNCLTGLPYTALRPDVRQFAKYLLWLSLFDVCSSEWKPAVDLAAIDCATRENRKVCTSYGIRGFPTIKVTASSLHRLSNHIKSSLLALMLMFHVIPHQTLKRNNIIFNSMLLPYIFWTGHTIRKTHRFALRFEFLLSTWICLSYVCM